MDAQSRRLRAGRPWPVVTGGDAAASDLQRAHAREENASVAGPLPLPRRHGPATSHFGAWEV